MNDQQALHEQSTNAELRRGTGEAGKTLPPEKRRGLKKFGLRFSFRGSLEGADQSIPRGVSFLHSAERLNAGNGIQSGCDPETEEKAGMGPDCGKTEK